MCARARACAFVRVELTKALARERTLIKQDRKFKNISLYYFQRRSEQDCQIQFDLTDKFSDIKPGLAGVSEVYWRPCLRERDENETIREMDQMDTFQYYIYNMYI